MSQDSSLQDLAWIGDAVLALYMRELMLENGLEADALRGELFKRFTSNQFLSGFGRPTEVEARIGTVYREGGLEAAFAYLSKTFLPVISRQLANPRPREPRLTLERLPEVR